LARTGADPALTFALAFGFVIVGVVALAAGRRSN